ncbi:MAG: bifunctional hydroxymethylpyrimidine kinase/phosphomethylpyrimidine kinase, partial [Magnetospiraceae bacterium]
SLVTGRVLIVAGSDSGGGAGIQADIKAVTALKGFAMTAITALTAQNTEGVFGIQEVPPAFIAEQIRVVLTDLGADVIKIGMLHRADVIDAVADALAAYGPDIPIVLDPVMVAKGGHALLENAAVAALKRRLLPHAALVTPNIPEAAALTGLTVETTDQAVHAGQALLALGPGAVLIKGGHLPGDTLTDRLFLKNEDNPRSFAGPRIDTRHTHGTGCTTASAIATGLAQGLAMPEAVERARDYVQAAIRTAPGFGKGHGPLNHSVTVA